MAAITLSEAIQELRTELAKAIEAGRNDQIKFQPGTIDLELLVTMQKEKEGKAGVKVWVAELGGSLKSQDVNTHKLKISLQPVDAKGKPLTNISRRG